MLEEIPSNILIAVWLLAFVLLLLPATKAWQRRHERLRDERRERARRRAERKGDE